MALHKIATIGLISPYLFASVHAQFSLSFSTSDAAEVCLDSNTSVLSACTTYYSDIEVCGIDAVTGGAAEITSCFCQQSLFDLGSSCYSQQSACLGGNSAALYFSPISANVNKICKGTVLNGGSATTKSSPSGTSSPNPGASSTQSQASPTASSNAAAAEFQPPMNRMMLVVELAVLTWLSR